MKMEEKYLSSVGGGQSRMVARQDSRQDPGKIQGPSQEQVLSWVDQVFHDLRQNKVRLHHVLSLALTLNVKYRSVVALD